MIMSAQRHKIKNFVNYYLSFEDRCKMIEYSIKDKDIYLDKWEGSHVQFVSFAAVWVHTQRFYDELCKSIGLPESTVTVVYCVGSDMLKSEVDKYHLNMVFEEKSYNLPLGVCIRNTKHKSVAEDKVKKYEKFTKKDMIDNSLFIMKSDEGDTDFSSTAIRTFHKARDYKKLEEIMELEVAEYFIKKFSKDQ